MLVGVSQPKFMSTGRKNFGVEKVECRWSGDSQVRRVCVKLNAAGVAISVFLSSFRSRLTFEFLLTTL